MTELGALQQQMEATYGARDRARGMAATVAWLAEEVGELAKAARKGTRDEQVHEIGDVLAWLASLANQLGISLDERPLGTSTDVRAAEQLRAGVTNGRRRALRAARVWGWGGRRR